MSDVLEAADPAVEPAVTLTCLELSLAPEDLLPLTRRPDVARTAMARPAQLVWLDDSDATLATQGRILGRDGNTWRIEALEPGHGFEWPPCSASPVLGEAPSPALLAPAPPFDAAPVAAFDGKRRAFRRGDVVIDVLHGSLRGLLDTSAACRVRFSGPAPAIAEAIPALAAFRFAVPRAALAREALAVARGTVLPPRHLGAPALSAHIAVTEGLCLIIGHLLDTVLHWVDTYRRDPQAEAVHQGRVATRRLRSALSLYKRIAPCPELSEAASLLQTCATKLGAARDWDVFLDETGPRLRQAAGEDRIANLLRAAKRRRAGAHAELAAFLAGPEFRRMELALGVAASLRPWERGADPATLALPTAAFAATTLEHRVRQVRRRGKRLDTMPLPELHELRKDCKRLRYAAEFFAPSFSSKAVKPFIKRLSALQEELGVLNDTAVAAQLMTQLGRVGRGYGGGIVEGWASATAMPARSRIAQKWKLFRAASPFWTS